MKKKTTKSALEKKVDALALEVAELNKQVQDLSMLVRVPVPHQPYYPPYYPQRIERNFLEPHYHDGQPCWNNPCVWC